MGFNMKKLILLFLTLLLTTNFSHCYGGCKKSMYPFEDLVTGITRRSAEKIEKELPILELSGVGGSMKDNIINHETLIFTVRKTLTKNEGIEIISKIIKIYINEIYGEKKMEGYLKEHPFTYKNLKIKLFIHDKENDKVYHPDIGFVTLSDGMISYLTVSRSEKGYLKKESSTEEPYEEAAKRVGVWKNLQQ